MAYAPRLLTLPADQPRLSRLICFILGCLTTLGFAPFGFSILLPILLLPILFVCVTVAPRDAAGHSFWYGFGLFLTGTYWIYISVVVFGQAPVWIAMMLSVGLAAIMGFLLFIAGWVISRFTQGEPLQLLAIAPAAWVLIEWLRGLILTGFPWMAFGFANIDSAFAAYAPVAGVYGVSFAVVLTTAAMLAAIMSRGVRRWIAIAFVLTPWGLGIALGFVNWTEAAGEPVRVTIVQGGIPQEQKWLASRKQATLDYYRDETRIAHDSEIVVWPEVAIPSLLSRETAFISQLQSDARENGQTILFGILEDQESRGGRVIYNSVIALDGERRQAYRKRHLVPFGEYFPVPDKVREWMRMMNLPHSDLTAGEDYPALIETAGGQRLGVAICYEDAYSAELLYAVPDAGILINASNDAWFGDSIATYQHLQIARMLSLAFGRPMVRSTSTGISAFISHTGELLKTGPQFTAATLTAGVTPRTGSTPYVSFGNAPVIVLSLLLLGFFWLRERL
jgi:apolipoprotein N-acyltransferase